MPDLRDRAVKEWILDQGIELPEARDDQQGRLAERVVAKAVDLGDAFDRAARRERDHRKIGDGLTRSIQLVVTRLDRRRRLRLLDWLGREAAMTGPSVPSGSEEGEAAGFIRQEAFELDRHEILRRLFAPERLSRLADACRAVGSEGLAG